MPMSRIEEGKKALALLDRALLDADILRGKLAAARAAYLALEIDLAATKALVTSLVARIPPDEILKAINGEKVTQ